MSRAWTKALVRVSIRLQVSDSAIFALLILPALAAAAGALSYLPLPGEGTGSP